MSALKLATPPICDLERATRDIFLNGLVGATALERTSTAHLERLVLALSDHPAERDKVGGLLKNTAARLEQMRGWLNCAEVNIPDPITFEVLTPATQVCKGPLMQMAFTLAALKGYGVAVYRFLMLMSEPAGFPDLRGHFELLHSEDSDTAEWLSRNVETLAIRQLQHDGILAQ